MELHGKRSFRSVICLVSLLVCVSAPLAAQRGIDLLNADEVLNASRGGTEQGPNTARVRLVDPPVGVEEATHGTATYLFDDGVFENFKDDPLIPLTAFEQEYAQLFDLDKAADLVSVTACFLRPATDQGRDVYYDLYFYDHDDDEDDPGERDPLRYMVEGDIRRAGHHACINVSGILGGKPLRRGEVWVAIRWQSNTNKVLGEDRYTEDDPRPRDEDKLLAWDDETQVRFRTRSELGRWSDWEDPRLNVANTVKAYGIRITVDESPHGSAPEPDPTPTPDPEPEPEPEDNVDPGPLTFPPPGPGYSNCVPSTARLVFDGDFRVSMCFETKDGEKGEGRAGIWKSDQSGLLWFFEQNNAEVLIKVLDGCAINGYRWVYVAPVTDLAFNLYVTDGKTRTWPHHNMQGQVAPTKADVKAFKCSP